MMIDSAFGISVVTVTLNECSKLKGTIESVRSFKKSNSDIPIEHWIIDGGSKDSTIDLLQQQNDNMLKFISESDEGIYHAMNKGARLSNFDYVVYINTGDTLNDIRFSQDLVQQLKEGVAQKNLAGFAFSAIYKIGVVARRVASRSVNPKAPVMPGLHQGMLYKRRCLIEMPYNQQFRICGDYEQFARMYLKGYNFIPFAEVLSTLYAGGISTKYPWKLYSESTQITKSYFKLQPWLICIVKIKLITALIYVRLILICSKMIVYLNLSKKQLNKNIKCQLFFFISFFIMLYAS